MTISRNNLLCLFLLFLYIHVMKLCVLCNRKAHNFITYKNNGRSIHLVASTHVSHIHNAAQSCKHMQDYYSQRRLSNICKITSPRGGYPTLSTQPFLAKLCHQMKIHLLFGSKRKDDYPGVHRLKKAHGI